MVEIKFSANQVYSVIKPYTLTPEQAAAVEQASFTSPALVVAGAGSGKTELMAVRVLWLVANQIARPEEILGLTFTRKAAAELSKRVYESLLRLRDTPMWPEGLEYDFSPPNISTYNAYANNLFRDNALAIGYESDAVLLSDAAAFQLAREVVLTHGSDADLRLSELDQNLNSLVESVLALAQSMNDNLVTAVQVEAEVQQVAQVLAELPRKAGSADTTPFAYMQGLVQPVMATPIIAKLAEAYALEKQRQGFVDYSDQVALAEKAAREVPGVADLERAKYRQVLLDEYQDTSFLQTRLLQHLFAQTSVFAVGDPNQAIYGWRGASASNLANFYQDFSAPADANSFSLSTSWRNPKKVLDLANRLIGDLKAVELVPAPTAQLGQIDVRFEDTIKAEAQSVAKWFKAKDLSQESSALLMRKRSQMPLFVEALEAQGIEVEVVGLGGLLEMPEIVDLVSALRVIHNPQAGSQLIRLLSGPRWRIGPKDIERLHRYATKVARFEDTIRAKQQEGLSAEDSISIVDALDALLEEKHPEKFGFSEIGLPRLLNAAQLLRSMRRQTGLSLTEYVRAVEQELWLDIEVSANPRRKNPLSHLNAFANIVANYSANNHQPYLGAFLDWLEFADQREKFEVPTANPEAGLVQVLTIHAAKGLEWDNVAIANLIEGDFPGDSKNSSGWLGVGKLPYPLRGDSQALPKWQYLQVSTQPEAKESVEAFKLANKAHQLKEELRLMYVAVTRPKANLLLSGSYWKPGNAKVRQPSQFLLSAAQHLGLELPENQLEVNPLDDHQLVESWPLDPLGEKHRLQLEGAKEQVETALTNVFQGTAGQPTPAVSSTTRFSSARILADIELLLGEKDQAVQLANRVQLPVRIQASRFKDYITDFENLAQKIRRPMPARPYQETRDGTLFHTWVEQHYAGRVTEVTNPSLQPLIETFEKSRWFNEVPVAVEQEIQLTMGGNTFICKIDAVFATESGIEIVDWKTGKPPADSDDLAAKALQLALYRLAYSKFAGVPIEQIGACFYFVKEGLEVSPGSLLTESELLELWGAVVNRAKA